MTPTRPTRRGRFVSALAAAAALACGSDPVSVAVTDTRSQTVRVPVGADFSVKLGTVGPGSYTPPAISAPSVVHYATVEEVGPNVPAGVRQLFHFKAAARGQAILTFTHTGIDPTIQDTVQVY